MLAGRYRIVAFLGQGAVGEVYEAEDLELGERVAVKALRPEIARDESVLLRFKQEILLAHRVTHPNVCRTFDLVYHSEQDTERSVFLTMELLRGETLAERLARSGRFSPGEALPIVRQVAAALAAAHAAGVVHRDLKSGNVFLVAPPGEARAVVTDFGLARSQGVPGSPSATLTGSGEMVGSPAYMAPEQVRGEPTSPATDIYALGIVLYEMVTGELPFVGESAFYTALKRLQEPPPSPRESTPGLDPAWERAILRCLALKPEDRFASVGEVVAALEEGTGGGRPPRFARAGWIAAAALGVALATGGFFLLDREDAPPIPGPVTAPRPSVAVLGFENLSRDPRADYLSAALFQMLPTELAAAEALRLVPVENIDRARRDLRLPGSASLSRETLSRLRGRLGADLVVTGAYLSTGGSTRFDIVVQDTRSGETVATFSETGTQEGFLATLALLGERLRSRLGAGTLPRPAAAAVRAARPATLESARLYTEGSSRLRRFDAPQARDLLERAVALEPENPLLRSALAAAWRDLGHDERARQEARRAFELSGALRREERRGIEARYREVANEWEAAIEIYRELTEYFPDNLEYGLRLAAAQSAAGRSAAAAETLARLRRLPPLLAQDPRIDLAEAAAAGLRSEYELQRDAAARAAQKAGGMEARLLMAEALLQEALALQRLGDRPGAGERFAKARELFEESANRRGVAEALRGLGALRVEEGRPDEARALYEEAIALDRALGNEGGIAETTRRLGVLYYESRDDTQAAAYFQRALAAMTRLRNRRGTADIHHAEGRLLTRQGDLPGARRLYERALAIQRETGYEQAEAKTLQGLALLAGREGNLAAARAHYERALAIQRGNGDRQGIAIVLHNMATVLFELGEFESARRAREEAMAIARRIGDREGMARGLRGLADIERQRGDLEQARVHYGEALAIYRELGSRENEMAMLHETASTLLLQGKVREGLAMLEEPLAFCREKGARAEEAAVLVERGRGRRLLGDLAGSRKDLETALAASREGDPRGAGEALTLLGLVHRDQGDLASAERLLNEALAIYRSRGNRSGAASALFGLGTVLARRGDAAGARARHEEARAIRAELGERLAVEESARALASL